jgi:hypothetical protein
MKVYFLNEVRIYFLSCNRFEAEVCYTVTELIVSCPQY